MLRFIFAVCLWATPSLAQVRTPAVNTNIVTTVGALPACNSGTQGLRMIVTDALTPIALATVAAGGAVVIGVTCNGSAWIVQ